MGHGQEIYQQLVGNRRAGRRTAAARRTAERRGRKAHERLGQGLFHADQEPTKQNGAKQAYEQFKKAVDEDPNAVSPDIALANLYETADLHDKAKLFIHRAVTRLPDDPKLRFATLLEASHWAIDSDEADEGLTYAKQAFDVDPKAAGAAEAKYYMGIAARLNGDRAIAEQAFEDCLKASPENFPASDQLAEILAEQKSDSEKQKGALKLASDNYAASRENDGSRRDPSRAIEAAATLGWAWFMTDHVSEAERMFEALRKAGVASPDVLYYCGRMYLANDQKKEAAACFNAALAHKRGLFIHRGDAQWWLAKLQ